MLTHSNKNLLETVDSVIWNLTLFIIYLSGIGSSATHSVWIQVRERVNKEDVLLKWSYKKEKCQRSAYP